jgi:hypothetical protein
VDLGHRHLGAAVATFDLTAQAEARSEVDVDGHPDTALDTVARLIGRLVDKVQADARAGGTGTGPVTTCVAGVPGPLNAARQAVASPMHLDGLRLGPARLHLSATGDTAEVHGTPADWTVGIRPREVAA